MTKNKFLAFYATLPEQQYELAKKWVEELFFMEKTLKKLQKTIREEGAIIKTRNGNGFEVTVENPAVKSYNTTLRNYNGTLKHLVDLCPKGNGKDDEFLAFVQRQKAGEMS